jgi:hypothetical protein
MYVDAIIILKFKSNIEPWNLWTGLIWFRIGTTGGLF